jgi:hypothetical protein
MRTTANTEEVIFPAAVIASLTMLPDYIAKAVPNPPTNVRPWYANTAPTYAGIFCGSPSTRTLL